MGIVARLPITITQQTNEGRNSRDRICVRACANSDEPSYANGKIAAGCCDETEANANANILSTTLDRLVWTLCVSGYAHPALGKENHGEGKIEVKEGTLRGKSIAERSYYLCWILFLCFYDGDAIDLISLTVRTCRF